MSPTKNLALLPACIPGGIEEVTAVREEPWKPVRRFAGGPIEGGYRRRSSSLGRNAGEPHRWGWEDDDVILAPRPSLTGTYSAYHQRWTASGVDFLEAPAREESDHSAIRRPEGKSRL